MGFAGVLKVHEEVTPLVAEPLREVAALHVSHTGLHVKDCQTQVRCLEQIHPVLWLARVQSLLNIRQHPFAAHPHVSGDR